MKKSAVYSILTFSFLLVGCASETIWYHDSASELQFERDKSECQAFAYANTPPPQHIPSPQPPTVINNNINISQELNIGQQRGGIQRQDFSQTEDYHAQSPAGAFLDGFGSSYSQAMAISWHNRALAASFNNCMYKKGYFTK